MKKSNKKGFTLAELLIVVAIIAVLTAIAVPLFVGALGDAEDSVKAANIRAVRSEATAAIVVAKTGNDPYKVLETDGSRKGPWKFTATVDKNGKVTLNKLEETDKGTTVASGTDSCVSDGNGGYTVTVYITADDLNSATPKNP